MRCAVLGSPIGHSLSPAMHRAAYDALGLGWTYDAVDVVSEGLEAFLHGLDASWRGLSLTMPLKRVVLPMLDRLDGAASVSGVANTVLLEDQRRLGFNTDTPGAAAAVAERVPDPVLSAVVIGGGATAASVALALAGRGCERVRFVVRRPERAEETAAVVRAHPARPAVDVAPLEGRGPLSADLVVSTVPASAQTPGLVARCADVPAVFEVVYDPWPTPLAQAAEDSGRTLVSGLDLLAHQACLQVRIMTGEPVPVELLRGAGREELARRASRATRAVHDGPAGR
jgi:shikimate dehydrogenase